MTGFLVFVGYLAVLLGIGFVSGRWFKGTSADFFLASGSIGPFMMLMSLFGATMTSFALVGSTAEAYHRGVGVYGLMASWAGVVHPLCFAFLGVPVWYLGRRHGYVTQIQLLRDRYRSELLGWLLFPVLVLLTIPYLLMAVLSAGFTVVAVTKGAFPEWFPATEGGIPASITGAVIVIVTLIYINTGGLRAAAWANALQTAVFLVVAAVTFVAIAVTLGGPVEAIAATAAKHPDLLVRTDHVGPAEFATYAFVGLSVGMFPHQFQHWLSARSAQSFKLTVVMHPILVACVWLPCIFVGLWAAGQLNLPPEQANKVLGAMVAKFSTPLMSGVLTAGILAAIMSSLDSQFLALGTMFTEDIVVRFWPGLSERQIVTLGRVFTALVGLVTWGLSFITSRSVFELGVWCFSGFSGLVPILVAALYWRRATAAGAVAAAVTVILTWVVLFTQAMSAGGGESFLVAGCMPVTFILAGSTVAMIGVSLITAPPPDEAVARFFPSPKAS